MVFSLISRLSVCFSRFSLFWSILTWAQIAYKCMIRAYFTLPCLYLAQETIVDVLNIPSLFVMNKF